MVWWMRDGKVSNKPFSEALQDGIKELSQLLKNEIRQRCRMQLLLKIEILLQGLRNLT